MLIDGRELKSDEVIEADICVAGAGPAGITLAQELAGRGIRVALLEAGGPKYDGDGIEFVEGESTGTPYYPLETARVRAYGGSSEAWNAHGGWRARPLETDDFEAHDWVARSGWPFGLDALEGYYRRAQAVAGLEAFTGWGDEPTAAPLSRAGRRLRTAGLRFADAACFRDTYADIAASEDVTLVIHASVTDILGDADRVEAVQAASPTGERFTVRAGRFVLALGGIENARVLLAARGACGIANEHDQVGRHFMEHPTMPVGVIRPRDLEQLEALKHYELESPNPPPGIDYRVVHHEDVRREERLHTAAFNFTPIASLKAARGVRAVSELRRGRRVAPRARFDRGLAVRALAGAPDVLRYATRRFTGKQVPCDALKIEIVSEQEPNPDSRVMLSSECDPLGVPRARLHWQLSDGDRYSIVRSAQLIAEAVRDSGAGRVDLFVDHGTELRPEGHYHHLGTTRMSLDPRTGVVDADCRVHSMQNLYVAGGSVFPTGGWANPTLTIVALAIRLADHLAGEAPATLPRQEPRNIEAAERS